MRVLSRHHASHTPPPPASPKRDTRQLSILGPRVKSPKLDPICMKYWGFTEPLPNRQGIISGCLKGRGKRRVAFAGLFITSFVRSFMARKHYADWYSPTLRRIDDAKVWNTQQVQEFRNFHELEIILKTFDFDYPRIPSLCLV